MEEGGGGGGGGEGREGKALFFSAAPKAHSSFIKGPVPKSPISLTIIF